MLPFGPLATAFKLTSDGQLTSRPDGAPPATALETASALFAAAEALDRSPASPLVGRQRSQREGVLKQLETALDGAKPSGAGTSNGWTPEQALQVRSSAGTLLLALFNASHEPELRQQVLVQYEKLARAEPDARLRESLALALSQAPHGPNDKSGAKALGDELLKPFTPESPPYERWFANGNKTLSLAWSVHPDFWTGFKATLEREGFKASEPKNKSDPIVFEQTYEKGGVTTKVRLTARVGTSDLLAPMAEAGVHVVGYEGHADFGRYMRRSIEQGPQVADGGVGRVVFAALCDGANAVADLRAKYPGTQLVTTFAPSFYETMEGSHQAKSSEGSRALLEFIRGVAARHDWSNLQKNMAATASGVESRVPFATPADAAPFRRVADDDDDGRPNWLDRHHNPMRVATPEDTTRQYVALGPSQPAAALDGTKVLRAASTLNNVSMFSGLLKGANGDSRVLAGGWHEPSASAPGEVVRFEKRLGPSGSDYVMTVSTAYAHASQEALGAIATYEFTRKLQAAGELRLGPLRATLAAVLSAARAFDAPTGTSEPGAWNGFLERYSLPKALSLDLLRKAIAKGRPKYEYSGNAASLDYLEKTLDPSAKAALGTAATRQPAP